MHLCFGKGWDNWWREEGESLSLGKSTVNTGTLLDANILPVRIKGHGGEVVGCFERLINGKS